MHRAWPALAQRLSVGVLVVVISAACSSTSEGPTADSDAHADAANDTQSDATDSAYACPATVPRGMKCEGIQTCNYGTESCCGKTYVSEYCNCSDGIWRCTPTDACYVPHCDEGRDAATDTPADASDGG